MALAIALTLFSSPIVDLPLPKIATVRLPPPRPTIVSVRMPQPKPPHIVVGGAGSLGVPTF